MLLNANAWSYSGLLYQPSLNIIITLTNLERIRDACSLRVWEVVSTRLASLRLYASRLSRSSWQVLAYAFEELSIQIWAPATNVRDACSLRVWEVMCSIPVSGLSKFSGIPSVPGLAWSQVGKPGELTTSPAFIPSLQNWKFNGTFLLFKLLFNQASINYPDKRIRFVIKCRHRSIGHTFLWVLWQLRYGQASPRELLRPKGASPGLKFVSPGRRTCEMDRPEFVHQAGISQAVCMSIK